MSLRKSFDATPAATDVDLTPYTGYSIRVGVAGDIVLKLKKDPTPITLKNVQAGERLELVIEKIVKVGTTAQNIILFLNQ